MKRIIKVVFSVVFALLLILLGAWLFLNYAPQKSTAKKKADMNLQATALYADFLADENASNQKYIGQILQVEGIIGEKLLDENQNPVLILREPEEMAGVMCTLRQDQTEAFNKLTTGQQIIVKGKCNGMLIDVVLDEGILEAQDGNPVN